MDLKEIDEIVKETIIGSALFTLIVIVLIMLVIKFGIWFFT